MYTDLYASDLPRALRAMAESKAMQRLALVGMHCGCEYTAYPVYARAAAPYSRLTHSRGGFRGFCLRGLDAHCPSARCGGCSRGGS